VPELCRAFSLIFVGNDPPFTGRGGGAPAALHPWIHARSFTTATYEIAVCPTNNTFLSALFVSSKQHY